jgi:hypothetical protein
MMEDHVVNKGFASISQRAVSAYLKALAELRFVTGEHPAADLALSQAALHAFFTDFYTNLFDHPDCFGLPLNEDASIAENEVSEKDRKQEVKRLLDKPKAMIQGALDFLMLAGRQGSLDGQTLCLPGANAAIKQTKLGRKFQAGFESAGLALQMKDDTAELRNSQYPQMMLALQTLATHCASYKDEWLGRFMFSSCDFRALQSYQPEPMELYRYFDGEESALVLKLHDYFSQKKYKASIEIHGPAAWVVKYQGNRKVKATPLFQIDFDDRYARSLRMQIKCASSSRIAELLPHQSRILQDDFFSRAYPCRGDECGWCRNSKTLGPTNLEYQGESKTVCWYVGGDVREFNQGTAALIMEYEQMHAGLAPVG